MTDSSSSVKLTGRRRHRVQARWFGKPLLVLQVEIEFLHITRVAGSIDTEQRREWFDAEAKHLEQQS